METTQEKNVNSSTALPDKAWTFTLVSQSMSIYKAERSSIPNGKSSDNQEDWWLSKGNL